MTTTVRQILQTKGSRVISIPPDSSILAALRLMAEHDIGSVLITEGSRLLGIFTERDYARKVVLRGRSSSDTRVEELMTANVLTVSPSQTIDDCMLMMTNNRFRHLPVVEHGEVIGIITIGDAVKAVMAEQEETINQLHGYISDGYLAPPRQ
ncbi:CBS domain-containing protein [Niveibacterium sp. SC-1]|uniref:CBS domain-containing protein n=1 Tax=Niveibacterium sp. SC-1 TaxID=3135646 RepID=UPI00311ED4E4